MRELESAGLIQSVYDTVSAFSNYHIVDSTLDCIAVDCRTICLIVSTFPGLDKHGDDHDHDLGTGRASLA